ncbi:MAG: carboxylesterase family protein, partial [Bacteroidales bacterium]|nr:carboxylesterase family protein [Bacteroidales bacterium]
MKRFFAIAGLVLMSAFSFAQQPILKTKVAQGEIEGEVHNNTALYKAIPYAEPPVGNLRWKAPVPKAPWQGVYKAADWGKMPCQGTNDRNKVSEDCLYLSVMTPAKSKDEKLPVFVMIHGGAYVGGHYAGDAVADHFTDEGIVYVSVEYRLGALGFMSHPELSKESADGVSGNYGIMDQILALQWIHDNIAQFGGDPDKVTIAGESAGGISVSILCASPLCKGLFRSAICESGSSFWPVGSERHGNTYMVDSKSAENAGVKFQQRMKAKNMKAFRAMDPMRIVDSTGWEAFWPVVDGKVIVDDQYKMYEAGNFNDVNILIGTNSDEGCFFTAPTPVEQYENRIKWIYGDFADRVLKMYPAANPAEAKDALSDIFRDGSFAWGTYAWANLQNKKSNKNVYLYYFDQNPKNGWGGSKRGAVHAVEMQFIYNMNRGNFTPLEQSVASIMTKYWINFTKN